MSLKTLFVFSKGEAINPVFLIKAQTPLAGTIIADVIFKNGAYYVCIYHNSYKQIESFVETVSDILDLEKQDSCLGLGIYHAINKNPTYATQI